MLSSARAAPSLLYADEVNAACAEGPPGGGGAGGDAAASGVGDYYRVRAETREVLTKKGRL